MIPFANHPNEIERQIIVLLVEDLLTAGFTISVDNGEEAMFGPFNEAQWVFCAMSVTDRDDLLCRHNGEHVGSVRLVYGNGPDVVSDYTGDLDEALFDRANALACRFRRCNR